MSVDWRDKKIKSFRPSTIHTSMVTSAQILFVCSVFSKPSCLSPLHIIFSKKDERVDERKRHTSTIYRLGLKQRRKKCRKRIKIRKQNGNFPNRTNANDNWSFDRLVNLPYQTSPNQWVTGITGHNVSNPVTKDVHVCVCV